MNRRRALVFALGALAPAAARAQTRPGPRRVGLLRPGGRVMTGADLQAFFDRLRALGYVEGRTIEVHDRFADGGIEVLPRLARELVDIPVEVIVAVTFAATEAAVAATRTIPIVMVHAGDPVAAGWIRSLARPGGNITGTTSMTSDIAGKQIELLHQLLPDARRIAVLGNPENTGIRIAIDNAVTAARSLGLAVEPFHVARQEDLAPVLARIGEARPDAMLAAVDALFAGHRAAVIDFATRARLPTLYTVDGWTGAGGLIAYAPNFRPLYPRAAEYVDRILRGANPAELPVEQPTTFMLQVNLSAARAIGIEIPRVILDRADEIVE